MILHRVADAFQRLVNVTGTSKQNYLAAMTTQGKRTAGSRRTWIHSKWSSITGGTNYLRTEECETVRLMLDAAWGAPPTEGKNEYEHVADFDEVKRLLEAVKKTHPQAKEATMNEITKSAANELTTITVENITMINGKPASEYTDAQLYKLIANEEAAIDNLNRIKRKPKRLEAEIARRQAAIENLVTYLDSQA